MKQRLHALWAYCLIAQALTAGVKTETITVLDTRLMPMSGIPVTLIETSTKERISKNTDGRGVVVFELKTGKEWAVNILQIKNYAFVEVPEGNGSGKGSMLVTYDYARYERTHRPPVDRSKLALQTVQQENLKNPRPSSGESVITLTIVKENKSPLENFPVQLTCYKLQKTYSGKTDRSGKARFLVPVNNEYEVDIDGIESFNYIDAPVRPGELGLEFTYQPTAVKETERNDTIVQSINRQVKGTSGRVSVKMKVNKAGKLGGEDVYLQMLKSNKVYKSKTNEQGEVFFLLPVKRKFMVHFRYQKDVDVLNYLDVQGIANAEVSFTYTPDPRLQYPERYIPTPQDLMIKEFAEFITKQFPEPKKDDALGLTLTWGNVVNAQSKEAVLEIGFSARKDKGGLYGPPLNIAIVVDKSGSMEGHDRIDALKVSLLNYVKRLRPTDLVSLIAFDDESTVLVPAQPVADGAYLNEDIRAGGGTNIFKGMVDGYEQVLKNFIPKGTNRVILLTDGYGVTPPEEIVTKSKAYNAKGIELSAVGVGEGYNQAMLSMLATVGGGLLHFAGEAKDIHTVFERELNSVLSPIAKDVRVEIIYNDKIIFKQLYGFPTEKKGNNLVHMKLDNIYSGLNKLALVKFELHQPTQEIEKSPVVVRMSYYDFKKQQQVVLEEKASLKWSPATGLLELLLEAQQKKIYSIAVLNQSLKVMAEAFASKDTQGAKKAVQSAINQVKRIYPQSEDIDVQRLITSAESYALSLARVLEKRGGK